jgi:hypothetical protein
MKAKLLDELEMANSYTRMACVLALRPHMDSLEWFGVLGREWPSCDNIASHRLNLLRILSAASSAECEAMMDESERKKLRELPEMLTIYRGCYYENRNGLSWTLNRDTAAGFVTLRRYRNDALAAPALLVTGHAARSRVVLKLDRGEDEIICPRVRRTHIEKLEIPAAAG